MIDVDRARTDTPGSQTRVHLDNARASLMPAPVLVAVHEHLELEARVGSAEAAELRADAIERVYRSAAELVNADPGEVTLYTGGLLDVMAQGAPYVVDVSPQIGRAPVDVQQIERPAVVAAAGAYLRGPTGTGFLVLRGGRRAEVSPTAAAVLGLGQAIDYARQIGIDRIEERVDELAASLCDRLAEIPAVTTLADAGVVTLEIEHRDPRDVAWSLRKRGITVGLNGSGVRVSPHYFNAEAELAQLADAVRSL